MGERYRPLRALAAESRRLAGEVKEAREYLGRLLVHYHPTCVPLDDLMGVCTQIDNVMTALPRAGEVAHLQQENANLRARRP